jgi:hypothetical protein
MLVTVHIKQDVLEIMIDHPEDILVLYWSVVITAFVRLNYFISLFCLLVYSVYPASDLKITEISAALVVLSLLSCCHPCFRPTYRCWDSPCFINLRTLSFLIVLTMFRFNVPQFF